jgi:hypothetical protein
MDPYDEFGLLIDAGWSRSELYDAFNSRAPASNNGFPLNPLLDEVNDPILFLRNISFVLMGRFITGLRERFIVALMGRFMTGLRGRLIVFVIELLLLWIAGVKLKEYLDVG